MARLMSANKGMLDETCFCVYVQRLITKIKTLWLDKNMSESKYSIVTPILQIYNRN